MMHPATISVGRDLLIIRNNEVIGKVRGEIQRGDEYVGVTLMDEKAQAIFDLTTGVFKSIGYKNLFIRFDPLSGQFLPDENFEELRESFKNTFVVDEFNFHWGMVPDYFDTVPGYRSAINEARTDKENENV